MFNLVKIVIDPYFLGYHWYYSRSLILLLFTKHTRVCLECVSCTSDASQEFKSHICCVWPAAICRTATERHDRACGDRIQTHWEAWECSSIIISLDLQRVQRLKATGPTEMVQPDESVSHDCMIFLFPTWWCCHAQAWQKNSISLLHRGTAP